jgi:hypothetical protein
MLKRQIGSIALAASCFAGSVVAGDFNNFSSGDLLIGFRGATKALVVDAGQISTLTGLGINQQVSISGYTANNFCDLSLNGVNWSAIAWLGDGTLFMTKARSTVGAKSDSWSPSGGNASQLAIINSIYALPAGANDCLTYTNKNTATAVYEPVSSSDSHYLNGLSFTDVIDPVAAGLYNYGSFQGNVENTTPGGFTTSGVASQSDLYQFNSDGSVRWVGYFELSTGGALSYIAYPTPAITSLSRTGNQTSIACTIPNGYPSVSSFTLRGTTNLATAGAYTNWPVVTTLNINLSAQTVVDTDSSANKFYIITAQ